MTTFEAAAASITRRLSDRLAAKAQARANRITTAKATAQSLAGQVRRFVLTVAGLAAFTLAAWAVDFRLGLAIGGVCAFYLEKLLSDTDTPGSRQ